MTFRGTPTFCYVKIKIPQENSFTTRWTANNGLLVFKLYCLNIWNVILISKHMQLNHRLIYYPFGLSKWDGMWSYGYTYCWRMRTTKTQDMPFIPTQAYACVATPRSLVSMYTANSCKGGERVPNALKWWPVRKCRKPWQKNIDPPGLLGGGGRRVINPTKKNYLSQNLKRKV
jgi:hypothetical protein